MEYLDKTRDVLKTINEYISGKKTKILILFNDMIADMLSTKKLELAASE